MDLLLLGDACMFLSTNSATECPMRRPCRSCLQTAGCMINTSGACVSNATASSANDFRQAFTRNLTLPAARTNNSLALSEQQQWEFPAFEATYCPSDDAVCATCTEQGFWYTSSDSRFCVGANGCICIHQCEVSPLQGPPCLTSPPSLRPAPLTEAPAPTPRPAATKTSELEPDSTEWWEYKTKQTYIGMAVFAVVLVLVCGGCCWFCQRRRSRRRTSSRVVADEISNDNNAQVKRGEETGPYQGFA